MGRPQISTATVRRGLSAARVKLTAKEAMRHVLSNSFGFGGVNASLVFSAI